MANPLTALSAAAGYASRKSITRKTVHALLAFVERTYPRTWGAMLNGLMMDDFQLSLTVLVERAVRLNSSRPVVSRRLRPSYTMGDCAQRARRVASGLVDLGIADGDWLATLLWNQSEHLEL